MFARFLPGFKVILWLVELNFKVQTCVRLADMSSIPDEKYEWAIRDCLDGAQSSPMRGPFPEDTWQAMVKCNAGKIYVTKDRSEWPEEFKLHVDRARQRNPNLRIERVDQIVNVRVVDAQVVDYPTAQLDAIFKKQGKFDRMHFPIPWDAFKPALDELPPDDLVNGRLRDFILNHRPLIWKDFMMQMIEFRRNLDRSWMTNI